MKKKDKNKGKKTLAAVSAVVAAGLTPGILAATPAAMPVQDPNARLTAAEVVAIGGQAYSFDELYAMQQSGNERGLEAADPQYAVRYGVQPRPTQPRPVQPTAKYAAPHPGVTMYGVPHPQTPPQQQYQVDLGLDTIQIGLMDYCIQLADSDPYTRGVMFTLDSDLTGEIEMSDYQLKELKAFIEENYGVEVSYHRFFLKGQLNTLRLISEYIYRLKTVWDKRQ